MPKPPPNPRRTVPGYSLRPVGDSEPEVEPLGVAPPHRRRGLAVRLCLEIAGLIAFRGGSTVYINGTPDPGYPAPSSAYLRTGFRLLERATTYTTTSPPR